MLSYRILPERLSAALGACDYSVCQGARKAEESVTNAFPQLGPVSVVYLQPRVMGLELTGQAQ